MGDRDAEFGEYVRRHRAGLVRTAGLLVGHDRFLAEDLVQTTLTKLYVAWPRARRMNVDAYVRRMLVNQLIDERRRASSRHEVTTDRPPDLAVLDPLEEPDQELIDALALLPARMRAAVVLRHVQGLSVEQTAAALRCTTGTVKSQTARGLDKLRALLTDRPASPRRTS